VIGPIIDEELKTQHWRVQYVGNQQARWAIYEPGGLLAQSLMAKMKLAIKVGRKRKPDKCPVFIPNLPFWAEAWVLPLKFGCETIRPLMIFHPKAQAMIDTALKEVDCDGMVGGDK
jgi:hypothetical protein